MENVPGFLRCAQDPGSSLQEVGPFVAGLKNLVLGI